MLLDCVFTVLLDHYLLSSCSLTFKTRSGMSLPLSRKQVACRQANLKTMFWTKEHLHSATYWY